MVKFKEFVRAWLPSSQDDGGKRLFSLDILRGLDMLLLTVIEPLLRGLQTTFGCFPESVMGQFTHNWLGFTLYDLIMPLFIFMCGAAMPFSLGRRLKEGRVPFLKHVFGRVALLWFLGGCVQGNWLALDPQTFCPYANTLQAIAIGYLATALMMMVPCRVFHYALPVVLAGAYAVLLGCDFTETNNLALSVERAFRGAILPSGNSFCDLPYTWTLTSLMFAAMTMCGYHATRILIGTRSPVMKAFVLFVYGGILLGSGLVASFWIPVAKPVYSLSFTLQAMGWSVIALAALYVLTDIWRIRRGSSLVLLFGQFALTAYLVRELFAEVLVKLAVVVGSGVDRLLHGGGEQGVVIQLIVAVELIAALAIWRRLKSR